MSSRDGHYLTALGGLVACAISVMGTPLFARQPVPENNHHPAPSSEAPKEAAPTAPPPVIIKVQPTPEEVEAVAEKQAAKRRVFGLDPEEWVAAFTAILTLSTALLWLETRRLAKGADDQSEKMAKSIREAGRSAVAMESVADSLAINAGEIVKTVSINREIATRQKQLGEMQMRAYVAVLVGNIKYQDKGNRTFSAIPVFKNSGNTAARDVRWRASADILPIPLPPDFKFSLPAEVTGRNYIPPHEFVTLNLLVPNPVNSKEIEDIKRVRGKALYAWGVVSYRDVFGRRRRSTFCHDVYEWMIGPNGDIPNGVYIRHNRAN